MESTPRTIVLVDGMAILFRGFYALISTPLTSQTGEPTGGTFAFTSALVRMLDRAPDLLVVAWDCAAPTFRHEQFDAYKANRAKFPDELVPQLARVKEIVRTFGVPSLEHPGFEADDIIGTLAVRAAAQGDQVLCVTPDKDYFQLVTGNIKVARPSKPTAPEEIVDIEGVVRRYGVAPRQVIDVLALVGDASDNIPGVKGIGEKTAIPLIQKFGSLDGLYERLEEVEKAGVRKKLEEGREQAFQARELVTIHTDMPLVESLDELRMGEPDYAKLVATFGELGFKSLVSRYRARAVTLPAEGTDDDAAQEAASIASESGFIELPDSDALSFDFAPLRTLDEVEHRYEAVRTEEDLRTLAERLAHVPLLSFDLETDGLDWQNACILGVALSAEPGIAYYVPVGVEEGTAQNRDDGPLFAEVEQRTRATEGLPLDVVLQHLGPLLENPALPKCGQNAKFDMLILGREGVCVRGLACDTMVAGYLLDSSLSSGMDAMAERYLNYRPIPITDLIGPRGRGQLTMRDIDLDTVVEYAGEDADITLQLAHTLTAELEREGLTRVAAEFDYPLVEVLTAMESRGVAIDVPALREISALLDREMARLEGEIYELAGGPFTINSPKQLGEVLFERLKLPAKRRTKTGYSTDQFVLEELASEHALPEKILEYRQAGKLKSTYVDALPAIINPATGRVHTTYHQTVASTGRLSSNNPNLQNIPIRREIGREIRKAFIPGIPNGVLLSADYSQIELRIMAHVCNDAELARAFREGEDIHTATAMSVFGVSREEITGDMRRRAKEVNFGIIYGIGPFGLARRLKISQNEAKMLIATYFERYPGVREYIDRTLQMARTRGYVETLVGRRRWFRELGERSGAQRGAEERAAINMPVQGTAADIIKAAMISIHREIPERFPKASMLLQVHDELVFEVPADQAEELAGWVKKIMESAFSLGDVPLLVETGVGANWFEAH